MIKKLIYILVCFFSFAGFAQTPSDSTVTEKQIIYDDSQVAPVYFDEQAIDEYRQDDSFDYVAFVPPDTIWTRFKTWLNDLWSSFIEWILQGSEATGILGFLVSALPYLIILAVVGLLVIETQNIQELIDAALKAQNYRLAVRFYYLFLLQKLAQKDIIDWQVQKTNADYVYEIKNEVLRTDFTRLTRIYDFIWYGNFEVSQNAFSKAEQEFKKTTSSL